MTDDDFGEYVNGWVLRVGKKIGEPYANMLKLDAFFVTVKAVLESRGIISTEDLNVLVKKHLDAFEEQVNSKSSPILSQIQKSDLEDDLG